MYKELQVKITYLDVFYDDGSTFSDEMHKLCTGVCFPDCEKKETMSLTYTCPTGGRTVHPDGRTKPEVSFNELR